MNKTFENIKKYSDFIQNRIQIEIFENPDQYDQDIEFWYVQYTAVEIALENIIDELGIKIHPTLDVIVANRVNTYIKIIEQKRNGNMTFEEFLELIIIKEWGEIKEKWYGYHIRCFNNKIAEKCEEIAKKSNQYATIKRKFQYIDILNFNGLNAYLTGYVGNQGKKTKNSEFFISDQILNEFNEYSNDFRIVGYRDYYIIYNLKKERENEEKEKEIDEIIDFLF